MQNNKCASGARAWYWGWGGETAALSLDPDSLLFRGSVVLWSVTQGLRGPGDVWVLQKAWSSQTETGGSQI